MNKPRERSPYAGCEVKTRPDVGKDPFSGKDLGNQTFTIEDWWENVYGRSWMVANGNPAAMAYGFRIGMKHDAVPIDNEVVYGKIGGMGSMCRSCAFRRTGNEMRKIICMEHCCIHEIE